MVLKTLSASLASQHHVKPAACSVHRHCAYTGSSSADTPHGAHCSVASSHSKPAAAIRVVGMVAQGNLVKKVPLWNSFLKPGEAQQR